MLPLILFIFFIGTMYFTISPIFSNKNYQILINKNQKKLTKQSQLINLFKQIRETEYEHDMGITSKVDFNRTINELKSEAEILIQNINQPDKLNIINCLKCNCDNESLNTYCYNCGQNLKKIICSKCSYELNELDKFCSQCGIQT